MKSSLIHKIMLTSTLILALLSTDCLAEQRQIALTIDDLPFVGEGKSYHLGLIIDALKAEKIPATGFVIAGNIAPTDWVTLEKFHDSGFEVGNHTLTHANLGAISSSQFIHEIDAADKILSPLLTKPKFFRYPYLAMGQGEKKNEVLDHLSNKNYHIATITIDSKDTMFNLLLLAVPEKQRRDFFESLRPTYIDFIKQQTIRAEEENRLRHNPAQPQVLLLHANLLNAYALPAIIKFYKENGYSFVNLEVALAKNKSHQPMSERIED